MARRFTILVGAIPIHENRVLLLQRSVAEQFLPGEWGLPCGKIAFGEDLKDAVLRELREEAGIVGEVKRLVGYSSFLSQMNGDEFHNVQINFHIAVSHPSVRLDKSSQAFKWVLLEEVDEAGLDAFTRTTIKQALEP